jgi:hypothetical protein
MSKKKSKKRGYEFTPEELEMEEEAARDGAASSSSNIHIKNSMLSNSMSEFHKTRKQCLLNTDPPPVISSVIINNDDDNSCSHHDTSGKRNFATEKCFLKSNFMNDLQQEVSADLDESDKMFMRLLDDVEESDSLEKSSNCYERNLLQTLRDSMGMINENDNDDDQGEEENDFQEAIRKEFEKEDLKEALNERGEPLHQQHHVNFFKEEGYPDFISHTFDIWNEHIEPCIIAILHPPPPSGKGGDALIFQGSTKSVQEFSEGCDELRQVLGIVNNEEYFFDKLLGFCSSWFPKFEHNFPVKEFERNGKVFHHATVKDHLPCNNSLLSGVFTFHVCIGGCAVFVGEYGDAKLCPACNRPRFYPCKLCRSKPTGCQHPIEDRRPLKVLRYKALTPVLIKLLKQRGFLTVLNCENIDRIPGQVRDNPDCKNYVDAFKYMKKQFILKYRNPEMRKHIVFVPIFLSVGYDGVQLHKHRCSVFKPLFISIQNLPPSFRNKIGVGTFLSTAFTSLESSTVEQFVFTDCLIRELNILKEGIEVEIDDQKYFICAYLFKHIVDTKELEHYTKVSISRSNMGCSFCLNIGGLNRAALNSQTYTGHRNYLPENHYLRAFGQSKCCCSKGYYESAKNFVPIKHVKLPPRPGGKRTKVDKTKISKVRIKQTSKKKMVPLHVQKEDEEGEENDDDEEENAQDDDDDDDDDDGGGGGGFDDDNDDDDADDDDENEVKVVRMKYNSGDEKQQKKLSKKTALYSKVQPYFLGDHYNQWKANDRRALLCRIYHEHYNKHYPSQFISSENCLDKEEGISTINNALMKKEFIIFHQGFKHPEFKNHIYCHNFDFRRPFQYKRVTHEEYLHYGSNRIKNFKGVWFYHLYPGARIDYHIGYDPMHDGKNIGHSVHGNITAKRVTAKSANFCRSIRTHGHLYQQLADSATIKKYRKQYEEEEKSQQRRQSGTAAASGFATEIEKEGRVEDRIYVERIDQSKLKTAAIYAADSIDRMRAEAWINAIIAPVGHKKHFPVKNIFSQFGLLQTDGILAWLINVLDFTFAAFRNYPTVYKRFHSELSYDLSEIFSPVIINDDWIDKVFLLYCETAAFHEALYPESEMALSWHHFVCGIQHMKRSGPVQLNWAFAFERGNSVLKRMYPRGGKNGDTVFFNRYIRFEDQQIKLFDFDPSKSEEILSTHPILSSNYCYSYGGVDADDGNVRLLYSDERLLLRMPVSFKGEIFTSDEYENLMNTIYINLLKRSISSYAVFVSSAFFRLYFYYQDMCSTDKTTTLSFFSYATALRNGITKTDNGGWAVEGNRFKLFEFPNNDFDMTYEQFIREQQLTEEEFHDHIATPEGATYWLTVEDIKMLDEIVNGTMEFRTFSQATIFGISFRSRGADCRETSRLPKYRDERRYGAAKQVDLLNDPYLYWPDNMKNELKHYWIHEDHYSSWAKIRFNRKNDSSQEKEDIGTEDLYKNDNNYIYGQFNYFMQIYSCDPLINNLSLASITCRRHVTIERVDHIVADIDGDSLYIHKMFTALDDVYSTPIMTCAFKSNVKRQNYKHVLLAEEMQKLNAATAGARHRQPHKQTNISRSDQSNSNVMNADFMTQLATTIMDMRASAVPYCISDNQEIQNSFAYATEEDFQSVSYIVMLEMFRNRKYIRYNHEKDKMYRENVFHAQSKIYTASESFSVYLS